MRKIFLLSLIFLALPATAQDVDMKNGEAVWELWCEPCHATNPRKHPGTSALQVKYRGEKPAGLLERTDLTPEIITFYVRNGISIMPPSRKVEISDEDLADLGAFLSVNSD